MLRGLGFWVSQITPCKVEAACIERKMADVSLAFWYATEFTDRHPLFIDLSYRTYLRREPDAPGRQFWLDELNRDNDYHHIARAFLASIEYRQRSGPA